MNNRKLTFKDGFKAGLGFLAAQVLVTAGLIMIVIIAALMGAK